jgi:hypothetical protein
MIRFFLFSTASRPTLGQTHTPVQYIPRIRTLVIKQPECEADHLPLSSVQVKNA